MAALCCRKVLAGISMEEGSHSAIDGEPGFVTNNGRQFMKLTVLVSEDRLSVNPKRHSVILPEQSAHLVS
jgi:hypothetical protein